MMNPTTHSRDPHVGRSYCTMVEKVKDYAIFLLDPHGVIQTWNPAATTMKGYTEREAIGSFYGMLYTPEDQAAGHPQHNLDLAKQNGTHQEERWRQKKDGSLFWALVEIIAIHDSAGELSGFCKITRDLTDHKMLNEQLARERERAQVTLAAISDAVISFDKDGKIDFINEKAESLTGWRAAEAKGRDVAEVVELHEQQPTGDHPDAPAAAVLLSRNGERREVEHVGADIRFKTGDAAGGVMVVRDISHVRLVEKKLKYVDRRKDEFLAMLAHELRNPLAPIAAAADLLAMRRLDPDGVQRFAEVIGRQVGHMTSLINDLLDVSRVTRGLELLDKDRLDCRTVIAEALEQVRPAIDRKSHHLTVDIAPGDAIVEGDKKRLIQVLTNVLGNAAKYTPPGGHIALRMELQEHQVIIAVQDDGIGMTQELVNRAFEMFSQAERTPDRAQGGLGLGLALVRSLVDLHGGSVTAESAGPGCGSKFTIALPRVQDSTAAPKPSPAPGQNVSADERARVLVVDDNVDGALLLGELLRTLGHEVAVEHSSRAALDLAPTFAPEVCLLDIGLPDLDGFELARRLRPLLPDSVLVAVTGYGQPQDVQTALAAGYDHHMAKPVDKHELIRVIRQALERKHAAHE